MNILCHRGLWEQYDDQNKIDSLKNNFNQFEKRITLFKFKKTRKRIE